MPKQSKPTKKPAEPKKAWEQPGAWTPKEECTQCSGTGMWDRIMRGDELVDWSDCPQCNGTGEEPKGDDEK